MSVVFLTAAFAAQIGKSSTKSVLIAVADRADDKTGLCFPSVADVVERTELDRKTVLSCLKSLEERKFLIDTGKRIGRTNQVKIWRLDLALIQEASQKRDSYQEASQKRNCSVFPVEVSRFSAITVPKTGHGTTIEPSLNKTTTNQVQVPSGSGVFENLIFESVITQYQPQLVYCMTEAGITDPQHAQDLIDELAGTLEAGNRGELKDKIGRPVLWLKSLATGNFERDRCFKVQARRQSGKTSGQLPQLPLPAPEKPKPASQRQIDNLPVSMHAAAKRAARLNHMPT